MRELSQNPSDRLGVWKRLDEVPDQQRLHHHSDEYTQRDVWGEYVTETNLYDRYSSERYKSDTRRAIKLWKDHTDDRGHHHALATPDDVNSWCRMLTTRASIMTVYNLYWTRIGEFYDWLRWHVDHPHCYDPFLMAANTFQNDVAGEVWRAKISRSPSAP